MKLDQTILIIAFLVEMFDLVLVVLLTRTYLRGYRQIPSSFTLGLLLFMLMLLTKAVLVLGSLAVVLLSPQVDFGSNNMLFLAPVILNVLEPIALLFLYRATRE